MKVLVTGAAGFIGSELAIALLRRGDEVVGIDNLNDYYDVKLKQDRLRRVGSVADSLKSSFRFIKLDIADRAALNSLFAEDQYDVVANLAAQAGVRYSLENPYEYVDSNLSGFANLLEGCRHSNVKHFVFASSSSVYGANTRLPFKESDNVDHPVSLYAAAKKANELMAHSYAHLYGIPSTGLRFFTVYGPWGRPDMAYFSFTRKILAGETIPVFNNGNMMRDFTYVDDIVEGVIRVIDHPAKSDSNWSGATPNPATSKAPYRIYNIGNGDGVPLMDFVRQLEACLDTKADIEYLPMQAGDVKETLADTSALRNDFGYSPSTSVSDGLQKFVTWYRDYYAI